MYAKVAAKKYAPVKICFIVAESPDCTSVFFRRSFPEAVYAEGM